MIPDSILNPDEPHDFEQVTLRGSNCGLCGGTWLDRRHNGHDGYESEAARDAAYDERLGDGDR